MTTDLSEDDAHELVAALAAKFGWAITYFSRGDVPLIDEADPDGWMDEGAITDPEWDRMSQSRDWGRNLPESMVAAAHNANAVPAIRRRADGSFGIDGPFGVDQWFDPLGEPIT